MRRKGVVLRWMYWSGRSNRLATASNRVSAIPGAAGIWLNRLATLEVRGRRTGHMTSFPVVVDDYEGERYLEVEPGALPDIPVDRKAPLEELQKIASQFPVFRIHPEP